MGTSSLNAKARTSLVGLECFDESVWLPRRQSLPSHQPIIELTVSFYFS